MKKLLCALLALIALFSLAACGNEKVTIYIPDTVELYKADGTKEATITYVLEDGWKNKESFTVTMSGDTVALGGNSTVVYGNKKATQVVSNGSVTEIFYNQDGKEIKLVNNYAFGGRREVIYTYDDKGRVSRQVEKMYETDDSEPVTTTTDFTYTETETGYTSTEEMNGYTVVSTYDKTGCQLSQTMTKDGKEVSRMEATYDDAGNMLSQISYANGQIQMEMKYTWKTAEVSSETAARLPQFKRAN